MTMGPIALFDKSFLQSLSVDESVWFDNFFLAVVCPVFFVETLADLAKATRVGRTPEAEVRIIAAKFPEMHGTPCVNYWSLSVENLLGQEVEMAGRVIRSGGRTVSGGGRTGTVFDESPEDAAFRRWQNEEFDAVERLFASNWRKSLEMVNMEAIGTFFKKIGVNSQTCTTLDQAYGLATKLVNGSIKTVDQLRLAVVVLQIPQQYHRAIYERWRDLGMPALAALAPYTAFVITIELFFRIARAADLITVRISNRTDIAYLYYIPFCQVFVSSDRLHQKVAPLFLRADQEFIWGQDLKSDLGKINSFFSTLPDAEKEGGLTQFAGQVPPCEATLMESVRTRFGFDASAHDKNLTVEMDPEAQQQLLTEFRAFIKGKPAIPDPTAPDAGDTMTITRRVTKKKGSWWQLPKDLRDLEDDL